MHFSDLISPKAFFAIAMGFIKLFLQLFSMLSVVMTEGNNRSELAEGTARGDPTVLSESVRTPDPTPTSQHTPLSSAMIQNKS